MIIQVAKEDKERIRLYVYKNDDKRGTYVFDAKNYVIDTPIEDRSDFTFIILLLLQIIERHMETYGIVENGASWSGKHMVIKC